jgi:hypothetical protein
MHESRRRMSSYTSAGRCTAAIIAVWPAGAATAKTDMHGRASLAQHDRLKATLSLNILAWAVAGLNPHMPLVPCSVKEALEAERGQSKSKADRSMDRAVTIHRRQVRYVRARREATRAMGGRAVDYFLRLGCTDGLTLEGLMVQMSI